jgi:hypothetical protein
MNRVLIKTVDNSLQLTADMGSNPPKIVGGFGGWTTVDRERRVALTKYQGRSPWGMTIHLMFDGNADGISQEHKIRVLTWMTLPPDGGNEPRAVLLYGALPFPSGGEWLINGLDYGDEVIWADNLQNPHRLRQDITITLLQSVKDDRTQFTTSSLVVPKMVVSKVGDTLKSIALRYLGDASRWREIADANGIRDPQSLLPNSHLRIPN